MNWAIRNYADRLARYPASVAFGHLNHFKKGLPNQQPSINSDFTCCIPGAELRLLDAGQARCAGSFLSIAVRGKQIVQARPQSIHFSTTTLPENDKVPYWREVFGREVVKVDMEPIGDGPFRSEARIHLLPALTVSAIRISPNQVLRTPQLVADGSDDFVFAMMTKGEAFAAQGDRDISFQAGQAILWSNAKPGICSYRQPIEFYALTIPRDVLKVYSADPDKAALRLLSADNAALRLLSAYLQVLDGGAEEFSAELQSATATHVHDLVGLSVGATREASKRAADRGVRAARLQAIKSDIISNISDRSMSADSLAMRHGVSSRYIRYLFRDEGTCLTDFMLEQRLSLVHRYLRDSRFRERPIGTIAYDAGFGDLSYFNNCFHKRYGQTPSAVRRQANGR